ncbi:helix-turn-helix domain-containing protein [Massilia cavernae]|uniref:XRE family transcriptional regulator n=1 Tax=Massilia cavernae TaxID=2320864 RepID=A0A418XGY4_9BURK|nr:helix-turn-helix transcriptional regulator [Massilia cavernae]RJG11716.1 XRE family transcriptional regulator [Massilia cavernae]
MRKFKSIDPSSAATFGSELRRAREERRETLVNISKRTGIHFGQLSRFEAGDFKVVSANLQKYANFLRIPSPEADDNVIAQFQRYAARSPQHHAACKLIVEALEKLG